MVESNIIWYRISPAIQLVGLLFCLENVLIWLLVVFLYSILLNAYIQKY